MDPLTATQKVNPEPAAGDNFFEIVSTELMVHIFSYINQPGEYRAVALTYKKFRAILADMKIVFAIDDEKLRQLLLKAIHTNSLPGVQTLLKSNAINLHQQFWFPSTLPNGVKRNEHSSAFAKAFEISEMMGDQGIVRKLAEVEISCSNGYLCVLRLVQNEEFDLAGDALKNRDVTSKLLHQLLAGMLRTVPSEREYEFLITIFEHEAFDPNDMNHETFCNALKARRGEVIKQWLMNPQFHLEGAIERVFSKKDPKEMDALKKFLVECIQKMDLTQAQVTTLFTTLFSDDPASKRRKIA